MWSVAGTGGWPQAAKIEDDVEVGANSTIDRGSVQDTVIGAGSRLDNLVQIGHNVRLGRCCVIVAQVGISGSTILEDFVQVGGQAAMAGHLHIGRGARIGAQAGVISDVPAAAALLGSPAQPRVEFFQSRADRGYHDLRIEHRRDRYPLVQFLDDFHGGNSE